MLICPNCSSENPDTHRFCQTCGNLLTEQPCPGCGSLVSVQLERCPVCQAPTGTTWYAICTQKIRSQTAEAEASSPIAPNPASFPATHYLDFQHRYRILETLPNRADVPQELTLRVLDSQPLQPSPLQLLQHNNLTPEVSVYLELQTDYHSLALPEIHDAWEANEVSMILLADRSHLPQLHQVWSEEAVLPLQMLHWLHEMATLWSLLEPYRACHSLLELSNLFVDEDHLLCLQRLYFDPAEQRTEIKLLADLWQQLFQDSQSTYRAELAILHHELMLGKVTSAEALRTRIESIALLLQNNDDMTSHADETEPLDLSVFSAQDFAASEDDTAPPFSLTIEFQPEAQVDDLQSDAEDSTIPFSLSELNSDTDAAQPETLPVEALSNEGEAENDELPTIVLPMRLVSLEDAARTDVGRQRDHNEDCFSIQTQSNKIETPQGRSLEAKGLYILCDGMGGHAGGEVASALAVETLRQYFASHWGNSLPGEACIREGIIQANRAIYERNQADDRLGSGRMGTTLVLVLIHNTEMVIAHVGDSRLYRVGRSRGLEQLTVDHEVGQREIQRGVEPSIAYARPDAYQLTQALGPRDENFINPDVKFLEMTEDSLLLLCSDGLSDNGLLERQWQTCLEPLLQSPVSLEEGVNQLINLANEQNGHDNVTAMLIRTKMRPNVELLGQKLEQMHPSSQQS